MNLLKKKVFGLPAGVWLAIIVAGVGIGLYIKKRNAANAGATPDTTNTDPSAIGDGSTLPSDPGYFPITGGGVPGGDGAGSYPVQLNPGTLRIKLQYPKRRPRRRHHASPTGGRRILPAQRR